MLVCVFFVRIVGTSRLCLHVFGYEGCFVDLCSHVSQILFNVIVCDGFYELR